MRFLEKWSLFLLPVSLPLAQMHIFIFAVPFYYPEILITAAAILHILGRRPFSAPPKRLAAGATLMFAGAVLSLCFNSPTIVGLGILKSWFFFPMLAAYLIHVELRDGIVQEKLLFLWFCADVAVAALSVMWAPMNHFTFDGRLNAVYPSPNHLAMLLEPGFLIGMYFLVKIARNTGLYCRRKNVLPIFFIVGTAILLVAILSTKSTSAIGTIALCLLIGWTFMKFELHGALRLVVSASAVLLVTTATVLVFSWSMLSSGTIRTSLASRVMIWNASVAMIADHPVVGIGPGRFQSAYLAYQDRFPRYLEWAVPHPHNIFLAFWLNTGLIGLFGFIIVVYSTLKQLLVRLRREVVDDSRYFMVFSLLFLLAVLIHGLTDTTYFKNEYAISFWIVIALVATKKTTPVLGLSEKMDSTSPRSPSVWGFHYR